MLLQSLVIKQNAKRHKRWVAVRNPQQQHLFESDFTVGLSVCTAIQPLLRSQLSSIDSDRRELLCEAEEQSVTLSWSHMVAQPADRFRHDIWVLLFAVASDERVAQLVDHTHGKQSARIHHSFRTRLCSREFVQALRQLSRGGDIRKDYVSSEAEQEVVQIQSFSDRLGDVKFHSA